MRRTVVWALAACFILGPSFPLPVDARSSSAATIGEQHIVQTREGPIYLEVTLPSGASVSKRVPAVLTYSPFSSLGRADDAEEYTERGYARVWADVIGTGNSGGCFDLGGRREKRSGHDVVEWIARQPWSTGKVAMVGSGYEGAAATGVATTSPKHLSTILPVSAPSSWYGYFYSGGIRHTRDSERIDTPPRGRPLSLALATSIAPPTDVAGEGWGERAASSITPCDEAAMSQRISSDTPDYDAFWRKRDYVRDARRVRVPVLVAHNWGDWEVMPDHAYGLFKALRRRSRAPKVSLFMGHRYAGPRDPGGKYDKVSWAWLEHYLRGRNNGTENLPPLTSRVSDYEGPRSWYRGPTPQTRDVVLKAQYGGRFSGADYPWKLLPTRPVPEIAGPFSGPASFPSAGVNAEAHSNLHGRNNHEWFWFESPYLKRDTRIFGEIKVQLYSRVYRRWVTMTPTIVDIDHRCHDDTVPGQHNVNPDCLPRALHSVTRGFLDSRYRRGLSKQVGVKPDKAFRATVVTKPQDYVFKKDHIIALNLSTEIIDWMIPKPYPGCDSAGPHSDTTQEAQLSCSEYRLEWGEGKSRVIIPVVGRASPKALFHDRDYVPHEHGEGR